MPNPPKLDPQRGHRGRGITLLPARGRQGDAPAWPLPDEPSLYELDTWRQLWATPQAFAWEQLGPGCVREVARYCRLLVRAEALDAYAALHGQATALADRLGLTPKAMRLLLWQIAPDEVGEKRAGKKAGRDELAIKRRLLLQRADEAAG